MCACGETGTFVRPSEKCNCDSKLGTWQEDSGFLTDKLTLLVTQLRFGDTDQNSGEGYLTLGKLMCYGRAGSTDATGSYGTNIVV